MHKMSKNVNLSQNVFKFAVEILGLRYERLRKYIIICTIIYLVFSTYIIYNLNFNTTYVATPSSPDIHVMSKVSGKDIMLNRFGNWGKTYIKGVDIGAGKPGAFPGDFSVTKGEYLRWFDQISKMNANTIRVYTILSPDFYEAFYSYNNTHFKKLYLIQGVWVNEESILKEKDAFSPAIIEEFKKDSMQAVDVIHGNISIEPKTGEASGDYTKDISKWVIGYILGIEWDGSFVKYTNDLHSGLPDFKGDYMKTAGANPFEIFLSRVGDTTVSYETKKYRQQRMIAFSNWPTTDPLTHSKEEESVNLGEVDVEHISATDSFYPGQFASYHVYPYYPDFFAFQESYHKPLQDGEINPYKAYLTELNSYHKMPVIISEYGVPASRGIARKQTENGYNQGNLTEKQQGKILADLTNIIHDSGCSGGLVFSWQDEWFKRTWNTMDYSLPDYRPYWSDYQTNEQSFGLLTFDPGRKKSICYVDGNVSEWNEEDVLFKSEDITVSMKSDEKFLYFRVNQPGLDIQKENLLIPIDITSKSGITQSEKYRARFGRPADFLIRIHGKNNSTVLVHDYYDVFTFDYSHLLFRTDPYSEQFEKAKGDFVPINLALRAPLLVESTGEYSDPSYFDTGHLVYGNANPKVKDFNSIADFYASGDNLEIRIPWGLLNIMDPSSKKEMDDFYSLHKISSQSFDKIYVGASTAGSSKEMIKMYPYDYEPWEEPSDHERLKESYPYVKEAFQNLE